MFEALYTAVDNLARPRGKNSETERQRRVDGGVAIHYTATAVEVQQQYSLSPNVNESRHCCVVLD